MKWLRSGAVVEAEHPAESLEALDRPDCRCQTITGLDQPIVDPLVIPLPVIVSRELPGCLPKRRFSEKDHPIEAFIFDRPHEPLGVGVQVGGTRRQADYLDAGTNQQVSKRRGGAGEPSYPSDRTAILFFRWPISHRGVRRGAPSG